MRAESADTGFHEYWNCLFGSLGLAGGAQSRFQARGESEHTVAQLLPQTGGKPGIRSDGQFQKSLLAGMQQPSTLVSLGLQTSIVFDEFFR